MICRQCQVKVLNPDKSPAEHVDVLIDVPSRSDIVAKAGVTGANGIARVTLNLVQTTADLTIRVCLVIITQRVLESFMLSLRQI